ncbi:MAG: tRNA pseudouridine(13) synthase TruD [Candidatus Spechtbacterales bacterium]
MQCMDFQALLQKEQKNIERVRAEEPEFFTRDTQVDDEETLKQVGILGLPKNRPLGYIKLWPQDFVVEEINKEGNIHTVELKEEGGVNGDLAGSPNGEAGKTIYADLVKVGLSTIDVRAELASVLDIDEKFIGTAGIKDRDALTSQLISFRNVGKDAVASLSFPNFFLKNVRQGKGAVERGMLRGNRFTITVRTKGGADTSKIESAIKDTGKSGFWNFYYLQRFGTPRLLTHIWGLYILQGEYEIAVKTMMTREGAREVPFFKELRRQAGARWGDWQAMEEIFELFPLSFRSEIEMLKYLKGSPEDFRGALAQIPQQVQLGVYAYSSFLFNSLLSTYIQKGENPPEEFPLFLSRNRDHQNLYRKFFEKHNLRLPSPAFRDFPFVQWAGHFIPTKATVEVHNYKVQDNVVVVDFSLPKGSYATSFLSNIFTLSSGLPVLRGIKTDKIDAFEILGKGSLGPTLDRFKDVILSKVKDELSANEEA